MIKWKWACALAALLLATESLAIGPEVKLEKADIDPGNIASLQRGARNFMNYCSGCHSAQYVRFNTIGKRLELSDEQLVKNLMFNADKTFQTINASMRPKDATRWYGKAPPDLSLMARAKGADYIYTFLKSFYIDPSRPTGVNNIVLPSTAMPDVLWNLQGYQDAVFTEHTVEGATEKKFQHFEQKIPGQLDAKDYDAFVRDTVNFLAYISEPIRAERRKLGVWVLMFLGVFFIIASMLKKQIWKDVT